MAGKNVYAKHGVPPGHARALSKAVTRKAKADSEKVAVATPPARIKDLSAASDEAFRAHVATVAKSAGTNLDKVYRASDARPSMSPRAFKERVDKLGIDLAKPSAPAPERTTPGKPAAKGPDLSKASDKDFAAHVLAAAKKAPESAKFGDDKVFIGDLHRLSGADRSMSLDAFKKRLLDQHFAGRLSMSRADLVGAMHPKQVDESEVVHHTPWNIGGGAQFHFVRLNR
jgi:hypothetical protein